MLTLPAPSLLTSDAVLESTFRREHKGFTKKGKIMKEDSILHKIKWCVHLHPSRSRSSVPAADLLTPQLHQQAPRHPRRGAQHQGSPGQHGQGGVRALGALPLVFVRHAPPEPCRRALLAHSLRRRVALRQLLLQALRLLVAPLALQQGLVLGASRSPGPLHAHDPSR